MPGGRAAHEGVPSRILPILEPVLVDGDEWVLPEFGPQDLGHRHAWLESDDRESSVDEAFRELPRAGADLQHGLARSDASEGDDVVDQ